MLHFGRNTRVTVRMDMLPRGSSDGSSGSHGMGMGCQSHSPCRYLYTTVAAWREALLSATKCWENNSGMGEKIVRYFTGKSRRGSKRSKMGKVLWLKTLFFQAQASHQKAGAEDLVGVEEARL